MIIYLPEGCASVVFVDADGKTLSTIGVGSLPDSVVLQPHPPKHGTPGPGGVIPDSFLQMPPKPPKPTEADPTPDSAANFPGPIPKPKND